MKNRTLHNFWAVIKNMAAFVVICGIGWAILKLLLWIWPPLVFGGLIILVLSYIGYRMAEENGDMK